MDRIGKRDKAVIRAFTEGRAAEGHKLRTDGKSLDIIGMGGRDTAVWKGDKIHFPDTGSRSGQLVQRAVAREAPKNDLYNGRGFNPSWSQGDVVQTTAKFEKAMKRAGARPVKRRGVVVYVPEDGPFVFVVEDDGRAGYMRADALEPQPGARKVSAGEIAQLKREHAFAIAGEEWGEGNPRSIANSHDPRTSAREFRAALDRANENVVSAAEAGMRGDADTMLNHIVAAAMWTGRAGAELKYAGTDEVDRGLLTEYESLAKGVRTWGNTTAQYMRNEMGIAANPARKRKRTSTSKAACTVGASAHKSRSAAARQCGSGWKASKTKFASAGGKAAARSPKSPIGKRKRKRSR